VDRTTRSNEQRAFEGLKVIDLTHVLAGPFCTYQLALLGAETIKIEHPDDPDIVRESGPRIEDNRRLMGTSYLTQNANKKSITLDLKTEQGREVLKRLVATADVFVENYRVGAMAALGLGYEDFKKINPRLIYCSMTGFGQRGPYAERNGYDQVIQAVSGLMSTTGTPKSGPLRAGPPIVDYASGLSGAFAISVALFHRERTGEGQHVDCSMFDVGLILSASLITSMLAGGPVPKLRGNAIDQAGVSGFETADGTVIMLGAFNRRQHRRFWDAMGRSDLSELDSLELQGIHREKLDEEFRTLMKTRSGSEWEATLNEMSVPAARVHTLAEALALEQSRHRGLLHRFEEVDGVDGAVTVPMAPFVLEKGQPRIDSPPPRLGAHNAEVLGELGYSPDEIENLKSLGAI
jgi:crotonobetainyl-CoA:carnitine CoA-transferase CaiB-like acyl-CoA transferase